MYTYTQIENVTSARRPPAGQYRLLWTERSDERNGLYYLADFNRAQLAIHAAETLDKANRISGIWSSGNSIVETSQGWIINICDIAYQMHTPESLLGLFCHQKDPRSGEKSFTEMHVADIEAKQQQRLPGWVPGDKMIVFWKDIEDATGARARPGDF